MNSHEHSHLHSGERMVNVHEQSISGISFPNPPGLCWLRRDSSLQAPSNTTQRACGQKKTKLEKQQTSSCSQFSLPLLPEPLPGQEAALQTLALGEEARCFQGPADLDLIKLSKHSKHKSTEKNEKCLHHLCQRHAKALSLDLMQGTQYLAPTLVRNVKFSSSGNTAEMVCRGKNMANAQRIHNCGPLL